MKTAACMLLLLAWGLTGGRAGLAQDSSRTQQAARVYEPTWVSLQSRPFPEWFKDAKLGIFIHWGVYSVPAYGGEESYAEWYLRGLQTGDSLRTRFMNEVYGEDFTYYDFAPLFKAELFDPEAWADLFKRAGARYVVLTAKHHDGYCLWPSPQAPYWNSVAIGPRRDLVGALTEAVRNAGLKMGLYYSLPEWNHPLHRFYADKDEPVAAYVEQHMIPQFKDLVSTYRPVLLFADGGWFHSAEDWHAKELIAWYYNLIGPEAIVNDRWGHGSDIGFLTPEYSAGLEKTARPWAEVRGLGRSFGLNRNEPLAAYMAPEELVHFFVRAVANGGGIILNVGPKADGQIPLLQQERLLQLGAWLDVNGEAIYGSRPWRKTGEAREVTLRRIDPAVDFNWARNTPGAPIKEDDFTATWTGFLQPRYSEAYRFEAEADDGVRVWIDGVLVVDQWAQGGAAGDEGESASAAGEVRTIRLEAGKKYPIRVEYYEEKQNAHVRLFWSSPSQQREVIPQGRFFTSRSAEARSGLNATYRSTRQYLLYTRNHGNLYAITLEWPGEELALDVDRPAPGTRITLLGHDEPLPWRYEDGTLHVDLSGISYDEMPGRWAWTVKLKGYVHAEEQGK